MLTSNESQDTGRDGRPSYLFPIWQDTIVGNEGAEVLVEYTRFNGRTYRRYPNAEDRTAREYFYTSREEGFFNGALHRHVWEQSTGRKLPKGWHVHHIDINSQNNHPDNLEAMPAAAHARLHMSLEGRIEKSIEALEKYARPAAAAWHGTPAGSEMHSRNATESWARNKTMYDHTCEVCSEAFQTRTRRARVCSPDCHTKARKDSGIDDEDRECLGCGKSFRINKYVSTQTCGPKCKSAFRKWEQRAVKCGHCGDAFNVPKGAPRTRKFCSAKCWGANKTIVNSVELECAGCKTKFTVPGAFRKRKFCERACYLSSRARNAGNSVRPDS